MKTYLLDSFNRFKRFSEELDAKTILCNKCWLVFNDSGQKETYIFKDNGDLIISISGVVTHGTWEYLPANKSFIINGNKQSFMVLPAFIDSTILALKVDGTENYAFLIDENNQRGFAPKTYSELIGYFNEKEQKAIEAEKRKEEEEKERQRIALEKAKRQEQEEKRIEEEKKLQEQTEKKITEITKLKNISPILISFLILILIGICNHFIFQDLNILAQISITLTLWVAFIILFAYLRKKRLITKYIKENPNDPLITQLKEYVDKI